MLESRVVDRGISACLTKISTFGCGEIINLNIDQ